MNTKFLMTVSSIFLAITGIGLSFLPAEILFYVTGETSQTTIVLLQIMGAAYLGFALLNWMGKNLLMGGIYSRPVATANFMHFTVSAIVLLKFIFRVEDHFEFFLVLTILYCIFSVAFSMVLFRNPAKVGDSR